MAKFTVSTKPTKTGAAVNTVVEVIDEGCERSVLVALATQAAVIKAQGSWRKHGIPPSYTIKLADMAPGKRIAVAGGMTREELVAKAKSDPAFRKQILDELGLSESDE